MEQEEIEKSYKSATFFSPYKEIKHPKPVNGPLGPKSQVCEFHTQSSISFTFTSCAFDFVWYFSFRYFIS